MAEKEESRTFTNIFLMTFRTFTTPTILFDMLVDRYNTPPPENLSDTHCIEWITHIRLPLRLRVLEVFGAWLEEHRLLDEEPYIARRLMDFLTSLDDPALSGTAEAMLGALERLVTG
jgi:son of sevenless-like protein